MMTPVDSMTKDQLNRIDTCPGCGMDLTDRGVGHKRQHLCRCWTDPASANSLVEGSGQSPIETGSFSYETVPFKLEVIDLGLKYPVNQIHDSFEVTIPHGTEFQTTSSAIDWAFNQVFNLKGCTTGRTSCQVPEETEAVDDIKEEWVCPSCKDPLAECTMGTDGICTKCGGSNERKEPVESNTQRPGPASLRTTQHGGDHYKQMKIEPATIIHANGLDWFEGTVLRYIMRRRFKGKDIDVKKAMHFCQMILEFDYGILSTITFQEKATQDESKSTEC